LFSKYFKALDRSLDVLSKAALLLSGLLLMGMAFDVTYGVVKRYVFHSPSVISIELLKIFLIPACVFAVSYVQRNNRHLRVDFIYTRFSRILQHVISEIFVPAAGLFVGYVLVWKGWVSMAYSLQLHETSFAVWAEPLWPVRLVIPIGYGLLCLIMLAQLGRGIAVLASGKTRIAYVETDTQKRE